MVRNVLDWDDGKRDARQVRAVMKDPLAGHPNSCALRLRLALGRDLESLAKAEGLTKPLSPDDVAACISAVNRTQER